MLVPAMPVPTLWLWQMATVASCVISQNVRHALKTKSGTSTDGYLKT